MSKEVKRTDWSRFLKRFSAKNRYRPIEVSITNSNSHHEESSLKPAPFLGVAISKNGRLIDGVQVISGKWDPEKVTEPVLTVKDPDRMLVETDGDGRDACLRIRAKDGSETCLNLTGETQEWQADVWVEKVAYAIYQRRGGQPGRHTGDWLEAEQKVRQAEMELAP